MPSRNQRRSCRNSSVWPSSATLPFVGSINALFDYRHPKHFRRESRLPVSRRNSTQVLTRAFKAAASTENASGQVFCLPAVKLESLYGSALLSISNTVFRCTIPSLCILDVNVVRGNPSREAAPFGPDTTPLVCSRTPRMWLRSASERVCVIAALGHELALNSSVGISNLGPDDRITARSMTFCNSRTLPGHAWRLRSSSASSAISVTSLFIRGARDRRKYQTRSGISSRRCLNG